MAVAIRQISKDSDKCLCCLGKSQGYEGAALFEVIHRTYGCTTRDVVCELCICEQFTLMSNAKNANGQMLFGEVNREEWTPQVMDDIANRRWASSEEVERNAWPETRDMESFVKGTPAEGSVASAESEWLSENESDWGDTSEDEVAWLARTADAPSGTWGQEDDGW